MIRSATFSDLEPIVAIYNQAVLAKFETADTDTFTVEERTEWLNSHLNNQYPVIVAEHEGGVKGWLSISPYRAGRKALQGCVEVSYYVDHAFLGLGIGSQLLTQGLEVCRNNGFHTVLTIILDRNERSIQLMKKFGFELWGTLPDIADFDGERCGHVYYGRQIIE